MSVCDTFHRSKFLAIIKYPITYMRIAGIFIPNNCLCELTNLHSNRVRLGSIPQVVAEGNSMNITTKTEQVNNNTVQKIPIRQRKDRDQSKYPNSELHHRESKSLKVNITNLKGEPRLNNNVTNMPGKTEFPKKCNCSRSTCLNKVFFLTVLAIHILDISRYCYILPKTYNADLDFVYSLADATLQAFFTFLFLTSSYACSKHYLPMCSMWLSYECKYSLSNIPDRTMRLVKATFFLSMFVHAVQVVSLILEVIFIFDSMRSQLWPFDMAGRAERYLAATGLGVVSFFGCCSLASTNVFRLVIIHIIANEFYHLHDKLRKILSGQMDKLMTEDKLHQILSREMDQAVPHDNLRQILSGQMDQVVPRDNLCQILSEQMDQVVPHDNLGQILSGQVEVSIAGDIFHKVVSKQLIASIAEVRRGEIVSEQMASSVAEDKSGKIMPGQIKEHIAEDKIPQNLSEHVNSSLIEDSFDDFVEQLRCMNGIMATTFDLIKHTIASSFVFTMPLLCFVLYGLVSGELKWDQIMLAFFTITVSLKTIVSTSVGCGDLRRKGQSVWSGVYEINWCKLSPEMLRKISVFAHQLSLHDFGYSCYGIFMVDTSTLLMVGGTILTYGVIVVQSRLGEQLTVHCRCVNGTV